MTLWFLRGLRREVVTTRYPARTDAWTANLPSPPAFRAHLLTEALADRLVAVCPSRALSRKRMTLTLDIGACTACGRCLVEAGPAAATSGQIELAATAPEHLIKQIPIGGESG